LHKLQESGVLVVDKPAGISSAGVVRVLKRILKAKKVGHAGTLDPFATGVLICCVNRATRLADFFLKGRKVYKANMILGVSTDTQDATGKVVSTADAAGISEKEVHRVCRSFTGTIWQRPPLFSALKHKGVPLYKLARKGAAVQKPPRKIDIGRLEILDTALPEVRFEVECSSGTYVRTLCADIGSDLGCGGHLKDLRRIKSCGFATDEAISLAELESMALTGNPADRMIAMADALGDMPSCTADTALVEKILTGKMLRTEDLITASPEMPAGFFKVVDENNRLIAVLDRKNDPTTYDYRCVFPNNHR